MNEFKCPCGEYKKFFGESFYFFNEEEKEEAKQYLISWKKNVLRKLVRDSFTINVIEEQWIEKEKVYVSLINEASILSLKICIEANFHYQLGK